MIDATSPTDTPAETHNPQTSWFNGQGSEASVTAGGPSLSSLEGSSPRERAAALGIEWLEEAPDPSPEAVASITADVAVRLRVVPIRFEANRLLVAMVDPMDIAAADEISTLTGKPITRFGLEQEAFSELMRSQYGTTAARMAESLAGQADEAAEIDTNLDAIE